MATDFLPLGCKFDPTKQELIGYFLTKRLEGQQLPSCYPQFFDFDIYSDHPSNLFASTNDDTLTEGLYFFTPLHTVSNKVNIKRVVGDHGTWLEKAATKEVYDKSGVLLGESKYYKFTPLPKHKNNSLNKSGWCMHEYSIKDCTRIVLAHIFKKKEARRLPNTNVTRAIPNYMIVDPPPLDNEAGPSKRRRVIDDTPTTADMLLTQDNNGVGEQGLVPDITEDYVGYLNNFLDDDNNNDSGTYLNDVEETPSFGMEYNMNALQQNQQLTQGGDNGQSFGTPGDEQMMMRPFEENGGMRMDGLIINGRVLL